MKPKAEKKTVSERVIQSLLKRHAQDLELEYTRDRAEQATRLHNAIVGVMATIKPSVETILYVFRMIEHELCMQENRRVRLHGPGVVPQLERPFTGPARSPQPEEKKEQLKPTAIVSSAV